MPPKKIKNKSTEQNFEAVPESESIEGNLRTNKTKISDEIEMMAIKYLVSDVLHPFHKLNGVTGSLDISKILDEISRDELKKGTIVTFIHEMDDECLAIEGVISHEKSFKIPKQKCVKYLKESKVEVRQTASDQALTAISSQLNSLNSILLKTNEENQSLKNIILEKFSPAVSTCTSPNVTRKATKESIETENTDLDDMKDVLTQRDFTNSLRSKLNNAFEEDPNQTLGYYSKKYPGKITKIKTELGKYVPANLSFNECWRKADRCLITERSVIKKKN